MWKRAKIFLHFSETSFSAFLRARWRHWKVRRPRCISSPWEKLLQRWRERQSKILHDIHQREWYMMRGSLISVSRYHPWYLTYLTWTCLLMPVLVLFNMLTKLIFGSTCLYYTHPLESYLSMLCVPLQLLLRQHHPCFPPPKPRIIALQRRVEELEEELGHEWSDDPTLVTTYHPRWNQLSTECGGSSMSVFTLRLRCVLPRVGSKCNGDCDAWHHTNRFGGVKDQRSFLAALT